MGVIVEIVRGQGGGVGVEQGDDRLEEEEEEEEEEEVEEKEEESWCYRVQGAPVRPEGAHSAPGATGFRVPQSDQREPTVVFGEQESTGGLRTLGSRGSADQSRDVDRP
ncbi:unnamed protein product [Boreogadus saida]